MAQYIEDSQNFSTVNASVDTWVTGISPAKAILYYNPTMVVNTWYRYHSVSGFGGDVTEVGGILKFQATAATSLQNGIIQKFSNLTVGTIYEIEVSVNSLLGKADLYIFDGLVEKSSYAFTEDNLQIITFTATSTENTLVLQVDSTFTYPTSTLEVLSISIRVPTSRATIQPYEITQIGEVFFTDGTVNNIIPNQVQCQNAGYTYNTASGTCTSFRFNQNLENSVSNINNKINGPRNTTQRGTNTVQINGTLNRTQGSNNNCLINGSQNEIASGVNNASVNGTLGEATTTNSIVLGANDSTSPVGFKQSIHLMYGRQTTTSGWSASYLNNTTASFFNIPDNTAMYFHADVLAVRVGGTAAGNPGDFASWVERGVIINKSGVTSIARERDVIKSSGTVTGWLTQSNVSATNTNFLLNVKGAANVTIEWAGNIRFTQIKTGVTL